MEWLNCVLAWFDDHEGSAGWLQAIFSIIAIVIALGAATKARTRETNETMANVVALLDHATWIADQVVEGMASSAAAVAKFNLALIQRAETMKAHLNEVSLVQLRPAGSVRVFITALGAFEDIVRLMQLAVDREPGNLAAFELEALHETVSKQRDQLSAARMFLVVKKAGFGKRIWLALKRALSPRDKALDALVSDLKKESKK